MIRTLQHIITSPEEPTEEERVYAQGLMDEWYKKRLDILQERVRQATENNEPLSGYYVQVIAQAKPLTVKEARQQFAFLLKSCRHSDTINLTDTLKQLNERQKDFYVYREAEK